MQAREDNTLMEPITVKQIADSWTTKDRFPVVTVTRDYTDNSASVEQVCDICSYWRARLLSENKLTICDFVNLHYQIYLKAKLVR